jgi:hypothetical protein
MSIKSILKKICCCFKYDNNIMTDDELNNMLNMWSDHKIFEKSFNNNSYNYYPDGFISQNIIR